MTFIALGAILAALHIQKIKVTVIIKLR